MTGYQAQASSNVNDSSMHRQTGLVGEQPAHRDLFLAGSAELRPVQGRRGVQIELAALRQQMGADRGGALGG